MQLTSALKAGIVVAALAFSTQAQAIPLSGSAAIIGAANETGESLATRTSFTITSGAVLNTTGDFNGSPPLAAPRVAFFTPVDIGTFSTAPVSFSISTSGTPGAFGTFTATGYTEVSRDADFLTGLFTGTFTPDVPGALDAFEGGPASFRISLTRSVSPSGASVSFSGTLALPPEATGVPEPASMALLGAGLLGLGLARRRKA